MPRKSSGDGRGKRVKLSHVQPDGSARMVDVSAKDVTIREATASAVVTSTPAVIAAIRGGTLPKGEVLNTARIAGVMAAKRTGEFIPLCHPLALDFVHVEFDFPTVAGTARARRGHSGGADTASVVIRCTARTAARTGVEMEALVGAAVAALTVYDMAKSGDKSMVIGPVQLERKSGGKSGDFVR